MKYPLISLLIPVVCACLTGCLSMEEIKIRNAARAETAQLSALESGNSIRYENFRRSKNWRNKVFRDQGVLDLAKPDNLHLTIVLAEQRGIAFVRNLIGYDFPVATGRKSHPTPTGDFVITAKERLHHSNRYGKIVNAGGDVLVENADAAKNRPAAGEQFQGAAMPYFLRLTNDGVGLHVGYIPGYPASHGCIRIPSNVAPSLYEMASIGTSVKVVQRDASPVSVAKRPTEKSASTAPNIRSRSSKPAAAS